MPERYQIIIKAHIPSEVVRERRQWKAIEEKLHAFFEDLNITIEFVESAGGIRPDALTAPEEGPPVE